MYVCVCVCYSQARYKPLEDPTAEEVKRLCLSIRRAAKDERVLFHYNGHGVPLPTDNGEIWVFNKVNYCVLIPSVRVFCYYLFIVINIIV